MTENIGNFWELIQVYHKKHIYLWIFSVVIILLLLTVFNLTFALFSVGAIGIYYIFKDVKFGWHDRKIQNLLSYRQMSGSAFTPVELKMLDNYFGGKERKEILIDSDKRKRIHRRVLTIDLMLALILTILICYFFCSSFTKSNDINIINVTGRVNAIEYKYLGSFLPSLVISKTIIFVGNQTLTLNGYIIIPLNVTFTFCYDAKTMNILNITRIDN